MDYDVAQTLSPAIQALFTSVLLIAMGSALFFRVIPVAMERIQKATVFYFMLFFFCIFSSFLLASLATFLPYSLVSVLTGTVYLVGYYALLQGLLIRQAQQVSHFFTRGYFYLHVACFVILSVYLFYSKYFGLNGEFFRIAFLTLNLIVICLIAITKIYKNRLSPTQGERVARWALVIVVVLMMATIVTLFMTKNLKSYLVIAVPIQIFNLHIVVLSLCSLLLSDSVNTHYDNSMTDALTGLPNRRYFMKQVTEIIQQPHAEGTVASMIVADIDHFKKINDRYGHDIGDKAIIAFANTFENTLPETASLARLGGEEFVVFLAGFNESEADAMAEKLRIQTHQIRVAVANEKPFKIAASFGIATFPMKGATIERYLRAADRAMYDAKDSGRNAISHYQTNTI